MYIVPELAEVFYLTYTHIGHSFFHSQIAAVWGFKDLDQFSMQMNTAAWVPNYTKPQKLMTCQGLFFKIPA